MANYMLTARTPTSITWRINFDADMQATGGRIEWYAKASSVSQYTYYGMTSFSANIASGGDITMSYLTPCTLYDVQSVIYFNNDASVRTISTQGYSRADYFAWETPKIQGYSFRVSAAEWNDLWRNVNQMRLVWGVSQRSFTNALPGHPFYAVMYNEVATAISDLIVQVGGPSGTCPTFAPKNPIMAVWLNNLVTQINSVN